MVTSTPPRPRWLGGLASAAHMLIVLALPVLLILINARLLMSEAFLRWEYTRPSFPADPYGFTTQDRLTHAPLALAYLFNDEGIDFLARQTFPDGTPLYNARELSHMQDVKHLTQGLTRFGVTLLAAFALAVILLAASPTERRRLPRALLQGSALTVAFIVGGLAAVAISFRWLFTQFHLLFFEGDSWLFLTSDTLIRLFPERFWADAFALMFGGALLEALILGAAMWLFTRRER